MNTSQVKRGNIFYADLDPVQGSEQGGVRPVLIVQNNIGNANSPTTQIVPLTSSKNASLPTHVKISRSCGLACESIALCEQLRTIDRSRLDSYVGRISAEEQAAVDEALLVSMELKKKRRPKVDVRTLCYRCKSEYEDSGYQLVKRGWQEYKEPCDRCQVGMGFDYAVFDRKNGRAGK